MLRIEVDMFSGRTNPVWILTGEAETRKILREVHEHRQVLARIGAGFDGLGLREVRVSMLGDEGSDAHELPLAFALASSASRDFEASCGLAERIIETMPLRSEHTLVEHAVTPLDAKLRELMFERLRDYRKRRPHWPFPPPPWPTPNPLIDTTPDEKCGQCDYEISQFNPGFWNDASQPNNNCYNYSRNWKTNTFAQPGRAHGAMTFTMACNTVTAAAMADGLVHRCDPCLPPSEFPRRLMALVIDPGADYHWYRHQRGGFWGHKPGQTAARNYDNSNVIITNPETADRGGYTDFCGYFYAGKSVVIS